MTVHPDDILNLTWRMNDLLKQQQALLVEIRAYIAGANIPVKPKHQCDECGVELGSHIQLLDHRATVHENEDVESEREREWQRLAELADTFATANTTNPHFEEDPQQRKQIADKVREQVGLKTLTPPDDWNLDA